MGPRLLAGRAVRCGRCVPPCFVVALPLGFASRRRAFFCGRRACWRGALCGRSAPGEPFPWLPCLSTLFTCHAHGVRFHASRTRLFPALHVLGSASLLPAYRGLCPWFHGRIVLPSVTHSLGKKKKNILEGPAHLLYRRPSNTHRQARGVRRQQGRRVTGPRASRGAVRCCMEGLPTPRRPPTAGGTPVGHPQPSRPPLGEGGHDDRLTHRRRRRVLPAALTPRTAQKRKKKARTLATKRNWLSKVVSSDSVPQRTP